MATDVLSGDGEAPTRQLGEALGVDVVFSEGLPNGKAEIIEELEADRAVLLATG
ncbi:MAG: hypothetical protein AAF318_01920 [Pseudomonadota bacterium]